MVESYEIVMLVMNLCYLVVKVCIINKKWSYEVLLLVINLHFICYEYFWCDAKGGGGRSKAS